MDRYAVWGLTNVGQITDLLDDVEISHRKEQFPGLSCPLKSIGSLCCGVRSKKIIQSPITASATCDAAFHLIFLTTAER